MPSFEKRKNGNWTVRFRCVENKTVVNKRLSEWDNKAFPRKKDALDAYYKYMSKYSAPMSINKNISYKYEDIVKSYMLYNSINVAEQSQYDKINIFKNFITPYFGGTKIDSYTKTFLHEWQEQLWASRDKDGNTYKHKYLTKIRSVLNHFLSYCEDKYEIPNLLKTIKMPKDNTVKVAKAFWELGEFNRFIDTVDDMLWRSLWYFFFYTGLRISEVQAFKESSYTNKHIYIIEALKNKTLDNTAYKINNIKNKKRYDKPIPDVLAEQLDKYLEWKRAEGISGKYLFGGDKPLDDNTIRRRLDRHITASGAVIRITPHGFRHSYVSMLINLDCNTKTVAELIGDTEEQVIKTYSHLYGNKKQAVTDRLNDYINQNLGTSLGTKN